jgi:hypothetical protein
LKAAGAPAQLEIINQKLKKAPLVAKNEQMNNTLIPLFNRAINGLLRFARNDGAAE